MEKKILIMVSMHRSGSSVIAQWLHKCGLHLGESLIGPEIGNTEGHFEDVDFLSIHEEYLMLNNLPDSGFTESIVRDLTLYQKEKLKAIIALKNRFHSEWGWKEPRTCLFLNIYKELLPNAYYLFILRDYKYIVSSLINRLYKIKENIYKEKKFSSRLWWKIKRQFKKRALYKQHAEEYLKVWLTYSNEMLNHIEHLSANQYIVIDVSTLINNDKKVFLHLTNTWKFFLEYHSFNEVYQNKYISKPVNIEPFVANKSLFTKANNLQNKLREYCITINHPN